jgi:positive regulator of sigma E activity
LVAATLIVFPLFAILSLILSAVINNRWLVMDMLSIFAGFILLFVGYIWIEKHR